MGPSGVATPRRCPVAPFQAVGARSDPSLAEQRSLSLPPTGSPTHGTASPGAEGHPVRLPSGAGTSSARQQRPHGGKYATQK